MEIKNRITTLISYLKSPAKRRLITLSKKFKNKYGLEIGGPSSIFRVKGVFPVYIYAEKIDGVNFSTNTIWEGNIKEGLYNYFEKKTGYQYIAEATDLSRIPDNTFDFILSSHSLEHTANPLKALAEWNRVLKQNGELILILPDKASTFDYNRPYTTFQHLLDDLETNQDERDDTHIEEILALHDFSKDNVNNLESLKKILNQNFQSRSAHHHVFNFDLIKAMLLFAGFETIHQQLYKPFHMITIARKNNKHFN